MKRQIDGVTRWDWYRRKTVVVAVVVVVVVVNVVVAAVAVAVVPVVFGLVRFPNVGTNPCIPWSVCVEWIWKMGRRMLRILPYLPDHDNPSWRPSWSDTVVYRWRTARCVYRSPDDEWY